jgi:EAL domain-containing protein (putative c-di-GMP-specific phosphodiesterase class I)
LKIDRSFVNQLTNQNEKAEIVRTIIALAHSLGMDAVAEGIESMYQLHELLLLKCKYGQGYFFSKPLNYQAATTLLDQYKSGVNGCDIITQYATPWNMRLREDKF